MWQRFSALVRMEVSMRAISEIKIEIEKVIAGKDYIIDQVFAAILAGGHILLEDVPGVGKTTLAIGFSRAMSLDYRRMQFTPDVLPSDVTGYSMYNKKINDFEYKSGVAMTNLLLADEINRTSPKTQAALLEVMEESSVTVDGETHNLPDPFIVIATQNPIGYVGTQKLPESQLDRFMIKLSMGYPDIENEIQVYMGKSYASLSQVNSVIGIDDLIRMRAETEAVIMDKSIYRYIAQIVEKSRQNEYVQLGISPRGGIALVKMAKATAYMRDRNYVVPEDVIDCMDAVMLHRLVINSRAKAAGITVEQVLNELKKSVPMPRGKE